MRTLIFPLLIIQTSATSLIYTTHHDCNQDLLET